MIEIIPATEALLLTFYGSRPERRVRAVVAVEDGEPIGVGGIHYHQGYVEVFSDVTERLKAHPKTLFKTAKEVVEMARQSAFPAIAVRDDGEPTANRFLERLGFVCQGDYWRLQ